MKDPSARGTSKILKFFDTLFDSVNGHTLREQRGKIYKCAASLQSGHIRFWSDSIKELRRMQFKTEIGKILSVSSLNNWICTLEAFRFLTTNLKKKYELEYIIPTYLNQDPLENFFEQMRQYGGNRNRNVNPSSTVFLNHFKTLLLNNLVSRHSLHANCQNDDSYNGLVTLKHFLLLPVSEEKPNDNCETMAIIEQRKSLSNRNYTYYIDKISITYVNGFISKKLKMLQCPLCKNNPCTEDVSEWHDLVICREYNVQCPNRLKKCTPEFVKFS
ncbi:hypothetical protein ABEB36_000091 [Hypothenemus hampei]|uniref:Uncharacterized protein n=1 Tax=Hypothenemus hampei TaxID=57062 RepID=A0ABD1FA95_HYPHA